MPFSGVTVSFVNNGTKQPVHVFWWCRMLKVRPLPTGHIGAVGTSVHLSTHQVSVTMSLTEGTSCRAQPCPIWGVPGPRVGA